jgi:hypothetical protein
MEYDRDDPRVKAVEELAARISMMGVGGADNKPCLQPDLGPWELCVHATTDNKIFMLHIQLFHLH